jgi:hypothetical protein
MDVLRVFLRALAISGVGYCLKWLTHRAHFCWHQSREGNNVLWVRMRGCVTFIVSVSSWNYKTYCVLLNSCTNNISYNSNKNNTNNNLFAESHYRILMCLLTPTFVKCTSRILTLSCILLMKFWSKILYYLLHMYLVLSFSSGVLILRLSCDSLGDFARLRKATVIFLMSVRLSVHPNGTSRLPLDGYSWNLILENILKIYRENSSFIKIGQERNVLYMKTNVHF